MTTLETGGAAPALSLETIERCFRGAVPAALTTADRDGLPNVTYLSRAHPVDDHRIALSNQFMSKTSRNLAENPRASLLLVDPLTFDEYRISLVYERTERRGPVFDRLRTDIDALAALTGMQDVFRLRAADVFRVLDIVKIEPNRVYDAMIQMRTERNREDDLSELAGLVSEISRAGDLDMSIDIALRGLARRFGYRHTYLLFLDETGDRLYTIASNGYADAAIGAEVAIGAGQVGIVAAQCQPSFVGGLRNLEKYSRTVRRQYEAAGVGCDREMPLPGLPGIDSRIAVPAMSRGQLVGVLVAESREPAAFDAGDAHVLAVVAALLAAVAELTDDDIMTVRDDVLPATSATPAVAAVPAASAPSPGATSTVRFFAVDGSTFVDGDYLIKGVAGRILWTLLDQHVATGRTEFTNKELRLDPSLDLPGFKDNLESRLLLLRRRLDDRSAPFRIVRTGRGRFRFVVEAWLELEHVDEHR